MRVEMVGRGVVMGMLRLSSDSGDGGNGSDGRSRLV